MNLSFNKIVCSVLICLIIAPTFGQETSSILTDMNSGGNYATSSGKEKQQSFSFVYGAGINSISFDVNNNVSEDGSGHQLSADAIQLDNQGLQTRVLVTAGETGSLGTAGKFNRILDYTNSNQNMSHILELMPATEADAHKPTVASNQNFWLSGKLKINGQLVKGNIVLGHNGDTSGNWWLGDRDGTRYDSASNSGINVVGENDGQSYCINDSETNNEAIVTAGVCNSYSPSQGSIGDPSITFSYGTKAISSVTFTPAESSDKGWYISEDGMGNPLPYDAVSYGGSYWYYNNKVSVSVGANGSLGTATDFNNLLGSDVNSQMLHSLELMNRTQSDAHQLTLAQNMNFWVKGTLSINGNIVSSNFIIGHNSTSDHNWWIGSPDGTRYDSESNSGMNVQYIDVHSQIHTYCLNQSKNNNSIVVSDGVCTSKTYDERYHGHWKWVGTVTGVTLAAILYTGGCLAVSGEEDPFLCRPVKRMKMFVTAANDEAEVQYLMDPAENGEENLGQQKLYIETRFVNEGLGEVEVELSNGDQIKLNKYGENAGVTVTEYDEGRKTAYPATWEESPPGKVTVRYKAGSGNASFTIIRENDGINIIKRYTY